MLKRLSFIGLMLTASSAFAQSKFSFDRLVYGGNFGAGFSTYETLVAVSPTVGYRFSERFTAGPGVIYQYYRFHREQLDIKSNNYGGKLYASYLVTPNVLAYSEYEVLDLDFINIDAFGMYKGNSRKTIGSWFVGGGYRQEIGPSSSIDLMLLFNLTETPYTPYSNPILRFGLGFGIR